MRYYFFHLFKKVSSKQNIGASAKILYNSKNKEDHAPQDSPSDGWLISMQGVPCEIQEEYQASNESP